MKPFTVLILIILLTVSAAGSLSCAISDEEAIEETVTGFFTAYENKEYSRSLEFLSERLKMSLGDEEIINRLRTAQFLGDFTRLKSMGELKIGSATATVWVDLEGFLDIVRTVQVSLIKENGNWKINSY